MGGLAVLPHVYLRPMGWRMQQIMPRTASAHEVKLNTFRQVDQNAQVVEMRKIHSPFSAQAEKGGWIEVSVIVLCLLVYRHFNRSRRDPIGDYF